MIVGLEHVAISVSDLDEAVARFVDDLGLLLEGIEDVPAALTRTAFVPVAGPTSIELVTPLHGQGPLVGSLAKRGPGLHHLCFRVANIIQAMDALKARGVKFIDDQPRQGAHGSQIAFLHPASAGGLLIELKQPAVARAEPGHP